jgi:signal peptidase I
MTPRWIEPLCRVYALSLYAYPKPFRVEFGSEMQKVFRDRCRDAAHADGLFRFFLASIKDWFTSALSERRGWVPYPALIWMLAVFMCLFASTSMLQAFVISAGSMEGTLHVGDHLLTHKLASTAGDIQRGDLITFLYPEDTRKTFVKRVIGLPGDRIRLSGKQVIRNGRRLIEPYAQHSMPSLDSYRDNFPTAAASYTSARGHDMFARDVIGGEVVVPPGCFFVLGDNRDNSLDSRYFGFIPREDVTGKPWVVYWSYDSPSGKTRWTRTFLILRSETAVEVEP